MPAYLSATIRVKDPAKLKEYISSLPATMAPFGAKLVYRAKVNKALLGDAAYHIQAVFEFQSAEDVESWWGSEAYQALAPIRNAACDGDVVILDSM